MPRHLHVTGYCCAHWSLVTTVEDLGILYSAASVVSKIKLQGAASTDPSQASVERAVLQSPVLAQRIFRGTFRSCTLLGALSVTPRHWLPRTSPCTARDGERQENSGTTLHTVLRRSREQTAFAGGLPTAFRAPPASWWHSASPVAPADFYSPQSDSFHLFAPPTLMMCVDGS